MTIIRTLLTEVFEMSTNVIQEACCVALQTSLLIGESVFEETSVSNCASLAEVTARITSVADPLLVA